MTSPILSLDGFGVAFGARVVLARVNLAVSARGATTIMGPVGVGKSTLLRTLAGRNDAEPSLRTWGNVHYAGAPWRKGPLPSLLGQNTRAFHECVWECVAEQLPGRGAMTRAEQRDAVADLLNIYRQKDLEQRLDEPIVGLDKGQVRRASLMAAIAVDAPLLLADEPTAGVGEAGAERVRAILAAWASERALLMVTHQRRDAREVPGRTALLAGGAIIEAADTLTFFESPASPITASFVDTGSCAVATPPSMDALLADGIEPTELVGREEASDATMSPSPPLAVRWVIPGKLAGVPRPGLFGALEIDLRTLKAAGVSLLVCLEESQVLSHFVLAQYGIEGLSQPVVDMAAPSLEEACAVCEAMTEAIDAGRSVAVHCRAGLGRTGTILASYFVYRGSSAADAISIVRCVENRFIQSDEQLTFIEELARHVSRNNVNSNSSTRVVT